LIEKGKEFTRIKSDVEIQKSRVDEFEHEITRLKTLKNSIESLNSSINLDPSIQYNSILARVSVRKMSGWWQQITIRKGQNYGIKPGNGVVFNGGVLGRVRNVDSRSSEIEIITNPNFRIVAHFAKDKRPVTYQGNGIDIGGLAHGLVTDVPHDIIPSIDKPIKLISSSLGGNFPHGIPIGMVYNLEGEKEGLFKTGKVILDARINQVHEVAILKQKVLPNNE
jgi:rod shape-determining protein MreC